MITISLCMIVKNEENVLARCLDTVADLVDEIIIVDTGSTDRTKEIAAKFTDKIYDFEWVMDFSAARNFAFSKATMEYIYAPDADEILDEVNRKRFLDMKQCLLPEIEIVQMLYVTVPEHNTVMNVQKEYRPKLFKRLRTFTWVDPVHETMRLDPVVYDSEIEILHKPEASHGKRDLTIFAKAIEKDGRLSKNVRTMYARELLKVGSVEDFEAAKSYFLSLWEENPQSDDGRDAACVLARFARIENNAPEFFRYALRDMMENPCAEICYDLGEYYEEAKDYNEAIVWYYNAVYETKCILDVETGGKRSLAGLVRCYEKLIEETGAEQKAVCQEALEKYKKELAAWTMPERL